MIEISQVIALIQGAIKSAKTFVGATSSSAGLKGMVPAPHSGDDKKFLRGDAQWVSILDWNEPNLYSVDPSVFTIGTGITNDWFIISLTPARTGPLVLRVDPTISSLRVTCKGTVSASGTQVITVNDSANNLLNIDYQGDYHMVKRGGIWYITRNQSASFDHITSWSDADIWVDSNPY